MYYIVNLFKANFVYSTVYLFDTTRSNCEYRVGTDDKIGYTTIYTSATQFPAEIKLASSPGSPSCCTIIKDIRTYCTEDWAK